MQNICTQAFINGVARFDGGSNVSGHIGWLDLSSLSPKNDATELTIAFDGSNAAAPDILRWAADGTVLDTCQIDLIKDGKLVFALQLKLRDGVVDQYGRGDTPWGTATLQYNRISIDYRAPTATSATTNSGGISGDDFDC